MLSCQHSSTYKGAQGVRICEDCGARCSEIGGKMPLVTHRLRLVTGTPLAYRCVSCKKGLALLSRDNEPAYADLDGKPFVDYYCATCATAKGATLSLVEVPNA